MLSNYSFIASAFTAGGFAFALCSLAKFIPHRTAAAMAGNTTVIVWAVLILGGLSAYSDRGNPKPYGLLTPLFQKAQAPQAEYRNAWNR